MKSTQTPQFLDYLHDHTATRVLADELAGVLALRGRVDLIPFLDKGAGARRIAS
jgi:hypothetical protein